MKKYLIIGAIVLVALIGGYFIYGNNGAVNYTGNTGTLGQQQEPDQTQDLPETKPAYSLAQIAEHATSTDCWFAIEGKVYNVTEFIAGGKHPGGASILQGCGKDATILFNTRPMGSGTPHSDTARSFLPNFYIGNLAKQ